MRPTFGMTTNLRSHSALGCSCVQGILLMTGGKPRFPAGPPCMVNKGKAKGLSRSHSTHPDQEPRTNAFAAGLESIPPDDWRRTWAADRTIMLRRTSKRVKEVVDKMCLPAVVRLSRSFWVDARNGTDAEKLQFVMRQLPLITDWLPHQHTRATALWNDRTRCREACRSAGAEPSADAP